MRPLLFRFIFFLGLFPLYLFLTGPPAFPVETGWKAFYFKDPPASRFVSGKYYEGLIFAGTHSPGQVYSAKLDRLGSGVKGTILPHQDDPAEAVLDLIVFQNTLYALIEKSLPEIRRWNRATGAWEPVPIPPGEGIFFAQVFQNQLYVTGSFKKGIRVLRSADGIRFEPEMRKIEIVEDKVLILLGGKDREYGVVYLNTNDLCQAAGD